MDRARKGGNRAQFDANVFEEFLLALQGGMRAYGGWDEQEPFAPVFKAFVERFEKDETSRKRYVNSVEAVIDGDLGGMSLKFDEAVMMKGLADAFFVETFDRLASERVAAEKRLDEVPESDDPS